MLIGSNTDGGVGDVEAGSKVKGETMKRLGLGVMVREETVNQKVVQIEGSFTFWER